MEIFQFYLATVFHYDITVIILLLDVLFDNKYLRAHIPILLLVISVKKVVYSLLILLVVVPFPNLVSLPLK